MERRAAPLAGSGVREPEASIRAHRGVGQQSEGAYDVLATPWEGEESVVGWNRTRSSEAAAAISRR